MVSLETRRKLKSIDLEIKRLTAAKRRMLDTVQGYIARRDAGELDDHRLYITTTTFTPSFELCRDQVYFWQVRAHDGTGYGEWSELWNFTIESYLSLAFTQDTVNFGVMDVGQTNSTDQSGIDPLIVENIGNVVANITSISVNASLFSSVGLDTDYFQFKADNGTTEAGSFNWTGSATDWTNFTAIGEQNRTVISQLQYNATNDEAEIDLKITVPINEPSLLRRVLIYLIGEG